MRSKIKSVLSFRKGFGKRTSKDMKKIERRKREHNNWETWIKASGFPSCRISEQVGETHTTLTEWRAAFRTLFHKQIDQLNNRRIQCTHLKFFISKALQQSFLLQRVCIFSLEKHANYSSWVQVRSRLQLSSTCGLQWQHCRSLQKTPAGLTQVDNRNSLFIICACASVCLTFAAYSTHQTWQCLAAANRTDATAAALIRQLSLTKWAQSDKFRNVKMSLSRSGPVSCAYLWKVRLSTLWAPLPCRTKMQSKTPVSPLFSSSFSRGPLWYSYVITDVCHCSLYTGRWGEWQIKPTVVSKTQGSHQKL